MEKAEEMAADVEAEPGVLDGGDGGGVPEGRAVAGDVHEGVRSGGVVPGEAGDGGTPAVGNPVYVAVHVWLGAPGPIARVGS